MAFGFRTILVLSFSLILLIGAIVLQIFLSRRESPWPGSVLPGLSFLYSILAVCNIAALPETSGLEIAATILMVLLLYNLPTLVLLAIYFACRGKYRRKREMDKMNAQDLE